MKSRIIALILIAVLMLSLFAGCGNNAEITASPTDTTDTTEPSDNPEADGSETTEPVVYTTFDYQAAFEAYEPDAVVLTVNGEDVTWIEYYGWLFSIIDQYEMYIGTEFAWTDLFSETQTMEEYAKFYAQTMCSQYAVVHSTAAENDLQLNDEETRYLEDLFISDVENYAGGDEEGFLQFLESTFMTKEYYDYINIASVYYQKLFTTLFGANGEAMTDEEVEDFIDTNGYLYAKHILVKTVDDTNAALDDAAKAEKLALAEDILAQLNAVEGTEEKLAKFDELMNEYSEDTGLASYPDGYYFLPGEMVTEFEEGTKALEYNGISGLVESPYGYHIILRLAITPDSEYEAGTSFRTLAASYAYDSMMGEKFNSAVIEYSEEFANLSLGEIFTTIEIEY